MYPPEPLSQALPGDPQTSRFLKTKPQERSKVFFVLIVILDCTESVSFDEKSIKANSNTDHFEAHSTF